MNVLFLTMSNVRDLSQGGIYADLMNELMSRGNNVFIVSPTERREKGKTHVIKGKGYKILKVRTLNVQRTNVIEKGIGQLLLEIQFNKAIEKYFRGVKFDLVLYSTPPITFNKVIEKIKKRDGAKSYLMLKDIFPQNAVDLGMIKENDFIHKIFRKKEEKLYNISDKIGCMSPANVKYILEHNPKIPPSKVEVCPNSIKIKEISTLSVKEKSEILNKLQIPFDKTLFIYGGNLGKPQGIDFLLQVLSANERENNSFIIIAGNGTEYHKIEKWFNENRTNNAKLIDRLPKKEYENLMACADAGLIFLDHRFSIPNYPSRLLGHLESCQPVLIASDPNTDVGRIAEENGYGLWCESNNIDEFMTNLKKLADNRKLREEMGKKGREFLEREYNIEKTADKILRMQN